MNKMLIVARREYLYNLRKPSFLFSAFGIPLLLMIVFAISIKFSTSGDNFVDTSAGIQFGFVDYSGVILDEALELDNGIFARYESEDEARLALDNSLSEDIQPAIHAYFVVAEDYMQTGGVQLFSYGDIPEDLYYYVDRLLIESMGIKIEDEQGASIPANRLSDPVELSLFVLDSGRELTPESAIPLLMLPIIFAVVFTMASQITGSFMMAGLVEEKTNRIIELLVTSMTPMQMMSGKIIGLGLLGLTELLLWIISAVLIFTFGDDIEFLQGVSLPIDLVIVAIVYFILGYFLSASIMAGIGVVAGSEQESRQYAGVLSILFAIPYFLLITFIENPNGTLPVVLSILPFTSPMSMVMRTGLTSVPIEELMLSLLILFLTTLIFMWLSARVFRWGVLMYGKKFNLRDLLNVLRGRLETGTVTRDLRGDLR